MREPTVARDRERRLTGVIDTLSAGFAAVNSHLWILAVPVLLDLFFWLGPRLSVAPLLQGVFGGAQALPGLPADLLQAYEESRETWLQAAESFNLLSLLVTHFPGIPSLMAAREGLGATVAVASGSTAALLLLLLPVAGLGLASVYYVAAGNRVRGSAEGFARVWERVWRTWWRVLAFLLLALGVSLLLGVVLGLLVLLAGPAGGAVLGFLVAFLWVVAMWVQFYLFFMMDAVVISDVGPLRAIRNSVAVVRFNTGASLGLVVLIWVITLGMPIVWDAVAQSPIGIAVGIVGNAYVATGLVVASMTFYRDRFAALNR